MPWDSQAQRESAELGNETADTRSALGAKLASAEQELGFGAGASNPYSRAAENKQQLTNDQRGITNAAGNNLYAGSTLNAQSQARSGYDKTQKGLEDAYAGAQADYTGGTARTARDEQMGLASIKEGAIGRASSTDPAPLGVGGGPAARRGRGRVVEAQNIRRPGQARAMNAKARAINARLSSPARGRR
jgi:hypothetical protein